MKDIAKFAEAKAYFKVHSTTDLSKEELDLAISSEGKTGEERLDAEFKRFHFLKIAIMETAQYWKQASMQTCINDLKIFLDENNIRENPLRILKTK